MSRSTNVQRPGAAGSSATLEREATGDLLHIDIKKLGRFSDVGHRITGDYSKRTKSLDWEYLFVAIDDHARIAFTDMRPDERKDSAESFLHAAVACFARMGVKAQRVVTDNGPAFHSFPFRDACIKLGINQKFTRVYQPQTNGKAARLIQRRCASGPMAVLTLPPAIVVRPGPPGIASTTATRPHHGIACQQPISRIAKS